MVDGILPDSIQLNATSGDITGMSTLNPGDHTSFTIRVIDAGKPAASDKKTFYIYGKHCALSIDPKSLPQASEMMTYELLLNGKGGIAPYRFDVDSGQLPSGLHLTEDGTIKGVPETQGIYSFMIRMSDAAGSMAQQSYVMDVIACETCPIISGKTTYDNTGDMPNVTLIFRDTSNYTRTTITDENGLYQISVPTGWSGTVIPKMEGYTFDPSNRMYQQLMIDQYHQDYVADVIMLRISGKVMNSDTDAGISDIRLQYGDAGASVQTNNNGEFNIDVPYGWSGTITPENRGYLFEPQAIQINSIDQNQPDQHFSAISTYVPQLVISPMSVIFRKPQTKRSEPAAQNETSLRTGNNDYHTGLVIPESVTKYWKSNKPDYRYRKRKNLPPKLDWSQYDSPVRNQGSCGSCWAFAGVALLENLANRSGLMASINLSEQIMVSCVYKERSEGGCSGGWYWDVFDYTFHYGIPEESCFPYKARNGNCDDQCEEPEYRLKLTDFTPAHGLWEEEFSVQDLKGALQDGPLSVGFYVPSSFYGYNGGIYDYKSGSMDFLDMQCY
ncbi:MAG: hypothetical protein OMM_04964 [Candidatus Magnetoglobus multicellularis str. Araruama]|uniref:Peptidase C1A papain C-terminal domain-containing protein n=1 Tax=Candidatus Magnetoglobus multicellularis str. Araruama TaxID=890399 RepID=A0A1V1NYR0_9BACT|nr:MAG: hypothetical protein OMM_04964 [Candidatus Magnetoglobus multicellularis str. Araruama]